MDSKDSLILALENRISIMEKSLDQKAELHELKSTSVQDLQSRVLNLENTGNQFSYSDYIACLSLLLSLITALCLVGYFFYNKYQEKQLKFRKFLQGKWGTEGDVTMTTPMPYIDFELEVDSADGEVTGTFITNNDKYPSVLSINGNLKLNKAILEITHFTQQRLVTYGKVKVVLNGKLLEWTTIQGDTELFPKKVTAWKN